jgi:CBS domain-containing protein
MTPAVFSVGLDTPARTVVESMLALDVRRVFAVDECGVLVGVVSAFDVLRHLGRPAGLVDRPHPRSAGIGNV